MAMSSVRPTRCGPEELVNSCRPASGHYRGGSIGNLSHLICTLSTMNTNTSTFEDAQRLLAEAGLSATPVESCHDDDCRWCEPAQLPVAA